MTIIESKESGYKTIFSSDCSVGWRIGLINYAERFDKDNIKYLEKHNLTDEAFILISGIAHLIYGAELNTIKMEKGKIYNIEPGEWHNIILTKESSVFVVENKDTSKENTDYCDVKNWHFAE